MEDRKEILSCRDRFRWREWLSQHFVSETEVWLVFPGKSTGEECVSYNDAVEEALCFGWIDGRTGRLDESHLLRRFTPRRKGSGYSQPNIERLKWLDSQGMIHPSVRPSVEEIINTPFMYPEDILAAIRKDDEVWKNYESFKESYKRIRIAYMKTPRPCGAVAPKEVVSFGGHKTLTYF